MGSWVILHFALIFGYVTSGYYGCKSDVDCPKTTLYATHCCRDFTKNSNLSCHVSPCVGHFCEADNECGGLCCTLHECTKCAKCVSSSDCGRGQFCCGKKTKQQGQCRSNCLGFLCRVDEQCSSPGLCCISKTCGQTGCEDVHSNIIVGVFASTLAGCVISFMLVFVIIFKMKKKSRRRLAVVPISLEMNATSTVLTMPTTYPCTNSSDRKNRTTSSSQKE